MNVPELTMKDLQKAKESAISLIQGKFQTIKEALLFYKSDVSFSLNIAYYLRIWKKDSCAEVLAQHHKPLDKPAMETSGTLLSLQKDTQSKSGSYF